MLHTVVYGPHVNGSGDTSQPHWGMDQILTFGERLTLARRRAGIGSQEKLGKLVGKGRSAVNDWETDKTLPEGTVMVKLPSVLGVSGHWLLTGDGPMTISAESERDQALDAIVDIVRQLGRDDPIDEL